MSKNNNVKCIICGKGYHLCRSCKDKLAVAPYKLLTDTSEHYKVYQVVNAYRGKIYTKEEAREVLKNVDISDKDTYLDSVKKLLDEILEVEKVEVENKIPMAKDIIVNSEDVVKSKKYVKPNKVNSKPLVIEKEVDIVVVNDDIKDVTDTTKKIVKDNKDNEEN